MPIKTQVGKVFNRGLERCLFTWETPFSVAPDVPKYLPITCTLLTAISVIHGKSIPNADVFRGRRLLQAQGGITATANSDAPYWHHNCLWVTCTQFAPPSCCCPRRREASTRRWYIPMLSESVNAYTRAKITRTGIGSP